jgi:hypothetical protein
MKKDRMSFDGDEPFFIYVEFILNEVVEDTNYLIAFFNPGIFFENKRPILHRIYETCCETFPTAGMAFLSLRSVGIVYL